MNYQKTFEKIVRHLYSQGQRALIGPKKGQERALLVCAYRGKGGTMCAIGCLIPDDVYDPGMEGHGVVGLSNFFGMEKIKPESTRSFLGALQSAHDSNDNSTNPKWDYSFDYLCLEADLKYVAKLCGLNTSFMDNLYQTRVFDWENTPKTFVPSVGDIAIMENGSRWRVAIAGTPLGLEPA